MGGARHSKDPDSSKKPPGKIGTKKSQSMIDDFNTAVSHKKQEFYANNLVHDDFRSIMRHLKVVSSHPENRTSITKVHECFRQQRGRELHD